MKCYSDVIKIPSYIGRYRYLKLDGKVGAITFGNERYINQVLYNSPEWKKVRRDVIIRDAGCDLAFTGLPIDNYIFIHHINPITAEDILERRPCVFDMDNLICVTKRTHNAIHYGDESLLIIDDIVERYPNDTAPWRR